MTITIKLAQLIYGVLGITAVAAGVWALTSPINFWAMLELDPGSDVIIPTFYAGVLFSVGVVCLLGLTNPLRYRVILLFMGIYKAAAVVALFGRAFGLLGTPSGLTDAGWSFAFQLLILSVIGLTLYCALGRAEHG